MYDIHVAFLVLVVFNTATFMYLTMKVVDYLSWKRHWRESRDIKWESRNV